MAEWMNFIFFYTGCVIHAESFINLIRCLIFVEYPQAKDDIPVFRNHIFFPFVNFQNFKM